MLRNNSVRQDSEFAEIYSFIYTNISLGLGFLFCKTSKITNQIPYKEKIFRLNFYFLIDFNFFPRACFDFLLYSIYEPKQPVDMRVVFEAVNCLFLSDFITLFSNFQPWQTVKRTVVLTPANFGEGPSVEKV